MAVKIRVPEGTAGLGVNGETYPADAERIVIVPGDAAASLAHRDDLEFLGPADAAPSPLGGGKRRATKDDATDAPQDDTPALTE